MRPFLDVLAFELGLHVRSPLFHGVLALFVLIHLLTISQVGVHLTDNELIAINSTYLIFRTVGVLGVFGMLPAMLFVVNAATRDHERGTVELVYATPVAPRSLLLGRFAGGTVSALLVGLAGMLGMILGTFAPWVPADRVVPFVFTPYVLSYATIAAPNLLIFSALSFAIAVRSRSTVMAFAVAAVLVVLALVVNNAAGVDAPTWLPLVEPFGALAIETATRYWSVAELNTQLPLQYATANRLLWLGLAGVVIAAAVMRMPLQLPAARRRVAARAADALPPSGQFHSVSGHFGSADTLSQFMSQLRLDLRAVFLSPLSAIVVVLAVIATVSEVQSVRGAIMGLPAHRLTSLMLGFFRYGLFQFVLMLAIFYAGVLVHRERDHGVHEIVGASPYPDWLLVFSKTLALCVVVSVLLLASMATCVVFQIAAGHRPLQLGVYLEGLFVYNGTYFYMLCVLAVVIQVLSPGKWVGMVLTTIVFTLLLALDTLGYEDLLYGFRIPYVVYSDMNGFGHFRVPTLTLVAYWSAFCVLLLVLAHMLFPRGAAGSPAQRAREAVTRVTPAVRAVAGAVGLIVIALGGWIYYNTHVLNAYETAASRFENAAEWERRFGQYKNRPGPSLVAISLEVDLYPRDRRLESRGRATLRNNQASALTDFVASIDPRLRLDDLQIPGTHVLEQDRVLGFYRFGLDTPLQSGGTLTMAWRATRASRGFVNSGEDNEVVENGTYVELQSIMPWPAYDDSRELTRNDDRRRLGLPDAARLPQLGDPAYRRTLGHGVDDHAELHTIVSTSADQQAVVPGVLTREWQDGARRYFEYTMERPVWPTLSVSSARYAVSRDTWNGVSLEVYHHAGHPWNVPVMLQTAKQAMEYFSREFAPYPLSHFRILEFPRYRESAQALPGTVRTSESVGFLTDLRGWAPLDYTTIHELAHHWWGGMAYGALMQGRQMLNETLAQYSTLMVFKTHEDPKWLRRILRTTHDNYLNGRGRESQAEQPLMLTEDQGNVSYNKGALVMFALQELIGSESMHAGLRAYLDTFAFKPPPFPTSRDLVNELRAVAGPEYQALITDLFEKVVLYDVRIESATARRVADGRVADGGRADSGGADSGGADSRGADSYDVLLDVHARKFESDGLGADTEAPLEAPFDVVIFPDGTGDIVDRTPIHQSRHLLHSGAQRIVVRVPAKPALAGVDPYHLMIDRAPADNVAVVSVDASN